MQNNHILETYNSNIIEYSKPTSIYTQAFYTVDHLLPTDITTVSDITIQ